MKSTPFKVYLKEIQKNLVTGQAGEHAHRPALKALLEAIGEGVTAINEPRRIECGAPDYIIVRAGTPGGRKRSGTGSIGRSGRRILEFATRFPKMRRQNGRQSIAT